MLGATSVVATQAVLPALAASARSVVVAEASRGAAGSFDAYHAVLADPAVEAVYLPLPNGLHRDWTLRAAAAGKHVLCEKPLARTAAEAAVMAEACAAAGVVLMEAYMSPFHPRAVALSDLLVLQGLGDLRFAAAAFTFPLRDRRNHRWQPDMGGGALLDVGIYCLGPLVSAAGHFPVEVSAAKVTSDSGVDASFAGWLDFGHGFVASFSVSFEAPERQHLELVGTAATAVVEDAFAAGAGGQRARLRFVAQGGVAEDVVGPDADPYRLMTDHFVDVVRHGTPPLRPPSDSIALLGLLDRLREAAA